MKSIISPFLSLLLVCASPFVSYAQNCYETENSISCGNIDYRIEYKPSRVYIENAGNTLLHQYIYKVGSDPIEYYTYANGWTGFAEMDEAVITEIENSVFSGIEWDDYTDSPGFIDVVMAINPGNGKVLEVEFYLHAQGSNHIFELPINKLYSIEQILKERAVCYVSQEIQEAMPSYVRSGFLLFKTPGSSW